MTEPLTIVVAETFGKAERWLQEQGLSPRSSSVRVLTPKNEGMPVRGRMAIPGDRVVILSQSQGSPGFLEIMKALIPCGYDPKKMEWV